ncbi:Lrp/AsnC family transcriptional regulator [uncultured Enterovirga sp.]|uniref:Lrp/AsnC family transcriptional regulator n=1 Tax=uncultured Enterovirga sp. TaxID=2026352 RepID=UPI0035CB7C05
MKLDAKDAKILNLVQLNNRLSKSEIGDEIGLTHSGVSRRLQRLHDRSVIFADVALVAPEAVGYPVRMNVSCSIERDRLDTYDRFVAALQADPMVVNADAVMGKSDFTFTVIARDMDAYLNLIERYRGAFPTLSSVTGLAVLRSVKRGLKIPVEPTSVFRPANR